MFDYYILKTTIFYLIKLTTGRKNLIVRAGDAISWLKRLSPRILSRRDLGVSGASFVEQKHNCQRCDFGLNEVGLR